MVTNMQPLVSIIVPVYNSAATLAKCVDSILEGSYKSIELLLVNDGSKDNSGAVCDSYAARDARVRVIHKANSGVSDTRNTALSAASGYFVQFVDSDDSVTPDATEKLVVAALSSGDGLVIADFFRVENGLCAQRGDIDTEGSLTRIEFAEEMIENPADFYYGVLWNKLYHREIIEKYAVRMDPAISWCEDFLFNLEYLRHCSSVFVLKAPVYYYVKNKGSLVNHGWSISNTIKMKLNVFEYYNRFYKDVYDRESYANIRLHVYQFFIAFARDGIVVPGGALDKKYNTVLISDTMKSEGTVMEQYKLRLLTERFLDEIALKFKLTLSDVTVLLYLTKLSQGESKEGLSLLTGKNPRACLAVISRLERKKLIEEVKGKDDVRRYRLTELAEPVSRELAGIENAVDDIRFNGISGEELENYREINKLIYRNIKEKLQTPVYGQVRKAGKRAELPVPSAGNKSGKKKDKKKKNGKNNTPYENGTVIDNTVSGSPSGAGKGGTGKGAAPSDKNAEPAKKVKRNKKSRTE